MTLMVFLILMFELICSLTSPVVAADVLMSRKTLWSLFGTTRKIEPFILHFHTKTAEVCGMLLVGTSYFFSCFDQLFIWHLCFRFDWFVPEDQLKERTLDVTVKNDVSFFSKSKTSMGQVLTMMYCTVGISSQVDNLLNAHNINLNKVREIFEENQYLCVLKDMKVINWYPDQCC